MNGSGYRRWFVVFFSLLLSFALVTPASAAKPDSFTIVLDDTYVTEGICEGFALEEHIEGAIKVSTHFTEDGDFTMEIARYRLRHTFTNLETGASLSSPDVGINRFTLTSDGTGRLAEIGLVLRIVVPGEGPVYANVGQTVYNTDTGEVLFQVGQHDADLLGPLCAALD